jgi:hypothetical protein
VNRVSNDDSVEARHGFAALLVILVRIDDFGEEPHVSLVPGGA